MKNEIVIVFVKRRFIAREDEGKTLHATQMGVHWVIHFAILYQTHQNFWYD
jgi:hypothetical protein